MQGQGQGQDRAAIGGTSKLGDFQPNYGVMPEQAVKQLQQGDGNTGEFVLIKRTRQGEQPQIWSSGDQGQTAHLLGHVSQFFPQDAGAKKETVTT